MIITSVKALFYISAIVLAFACIATANNMSPKTRKRMVSCIELMVAGATALVLAVFYETQLSWTTLAVIPVMWGITGWLLFDTYTPHAFMQSLCKRLGLQVENKPR